MNFSSFRLVDFIRLFDWIRLPQETDTDAQGIVSIHLRRTEIICALGFSTTA